MSWKIYARHANHLLLKSGIPQYEGEVMMLPLHRCTEMHGHSLFLREGWIHGVPTGQRFSGAGQSSNPDSH